MEEQTGGGEREEEEEEEERVHIQIQKEHVQIVPASRHCAPVFTVVVTGSRTGSSGRTIHFKICNGTRENKASATGGKKKKRKRS